MKRDTGNCWSGRVSSMAVNGHSRCACGPIIRAQRSGSRFLLSQDREKYSFRPRRPRFASRAITHAEGETYRITGSRHRPSLVELDRRAGIEVGFVPARQGAIVRLAEPGLRPLDTVPCSGKHTGLLLGRQHRLGRTLIALLNRASCAVAADDSTNDRARPQARPGQSFPHRNTRSQLTRLSVVPFTGQDINHE